MGKSREEALEEIRLGATGFAQKLQPVIRALNKTWTVWRRGPDGFGTYTTTVPTVGEIAGGIQRSINNLIRRIEQAANDQEELVDNCEISCWKATGEPFYGIILGWKLTQLKDNKGHTYLMEYEPILKMEIGWNGDTEIREIVEPEVNKIIMKDLIGVQ